MLTPCTTTTEPRAAQPAHLPAPMARSAQPPERGENAPAARPRRPGRPPAARPPAPIKLLFPIAAVLLCRRADNEERPC